MTRFLPVARRATRIPAQDGWATGLQEVNVAVPAHVMEPGARSAVHDERNVVLEGQVMRHRVIAERQGRMGHERGEAGVDVLYVMVVL